MDLHIHVTPPWNAIGSESQKKEEKKEKEKKKIVGYRAPAALPVPFQFLQANTCPLYLTLTGFDQNQELVHFGKLTPPQNGRIPEMQMPVFSRIFMLQDVRIRERKSGCGIYIGPLYPTWILTKTKKLAISAK